MLYSLDIPAETTDENGIPYDGCGIQICQQKEVANQQFNITNINYTKPTAPAAPTNIRVSATASGTTITWDEVPLVNQYDTRRYYVFLRDIDSGTYIVHDYSDTNRYTTTQVLQPGSYQVMLQSVNTAYYRGLASSLSVLDFSTVPTVQTYAIQVRAGTGGTVSGGGTYYEGDRVTVTATPSSGYQFSCWRNAVTGSPVSTSASYAFEAHENLSLTAEFTRTAVPVQTYIVRTSAGEGGTVTGGGSYKEGTSVTVRATAASGYDFVNWTEDGRAVSTDSVYTFTVSEDRNLTAVFAKQDPDTPDTPAATHTVRVTASPLAGGTVSGGGTYEENTPVTVTAAANEGYQFVEWREHGNKASGDASFTITASQDRELTAVFEETSEAPAVYAVHISATEGGTASGGGTYPEGASVTVRASAASGYRFVSWEENGRTASENANYTFEARQDRVLTAVFESTGTQAPVITAYDIRIDAVPSAGGTVSGGGIYMAGDTVTVTALPNGPYHFIRWTENGSTVSEDASYRFTTCSSRTLTAVFETETESRTHIIGVGASPDGGGMVTGGGSYQAGDPVTISAVPNNGYQFVEWQLSGRQISTTANYTFTASADQTFTAIFEKQDDTPTLPVPPVPPTPSSYTIIISASPAAGGTVSGGGRYEENASVTVTAVPNSGYRFVRWTESGREISKSTSYFFTANANRVFIAEFASAVETPGSSGNSSSTGTSSGNDHSSGSESNLLPVSVGSISHGTVTSSVSRAKKGDKVILTVHPNSKYTLETLTVKDSSGKTVATTKEGDSQYSFIMPATRVSINAVFALEQPSAKQTFKDVPESHWAEAEINWATENGIMGGFGDETFRPNNQVTRQQAWMVLGRIAGASPTSMAAARSWAMEHGISDGTAPGSALTRQQLVALLYRYAQLQGYDISGGIDISAYPDDASVANYAKEAMAWAVGNSIIGGTSDGKLNPAGIANRAQFAVIIYRFHQRVAE